MGHQQYIDEMSIDNERPEVTEAKVEKLIKYQLLRFARKRRLLCKNGKVLNFYQQIDEGTLLFCNTIINFLALACTKTLSIF